MGFLNPEGYFVTSPQKLEDAEGVKERIDPEMQEIFNTIYRGPLGMPYHALKAAAFQYAGQCKDVNYEYWLCKTEEADPRKCLKYGTKVSDCATNFFKAVTSTCQDTLLPFSQCLETSEDRNFAFCRTEQLAFDKCCFEKLGIDKSRDAIHPREKIKTDRPKPHDPHKFLHYDYQKPFAPDWDRPISKSD